MKDTREGIARARQEPLPALALRPAEEQRLSVKPESATHLGYEAHEIQALPRAVTPVA